MPRLPAQHSCSILNALVLTVLCLCLHGCAYSRSRPHAVDASTAVSTNSDQSIESTYQKPQLQHVAPASFQQSTSSTHSSRPRTVKSRLPETFWDLSLNDALDLAFSDAEVVRSLGGQIMVNPEGAATVYDPIVQETNPFFGSAAAQSQFDPTLQINASFQKNDDVFNNILIGGGANEVTQDLFNWNYTVSKRNARGTLFSISGLTQHDYNNATQNVFDHAWTQSFEASVRKPLLQGAGLEFNQIAGPDGTIGLRGSNGILLAKVNTEISQAQFERNVRDFVREFVSAYWQLYLAYRNYEAAKQARETAFQTWEVVKARYDQKLAGGEADREALAKERLLRFDAEVAIAVSGDGNSLPGIYQAEANLRRLMGLPVAGDQEIIKPMDEPSDVELPYDWQILLETAMENRLELKEQELRVRRREFEYIVAKNFTLPRLDAVALWRNNGFGDDRFGNGTRFGSADQRFSSSQEDFLSGDHQEWEFNLQFAVPIGRRLQLDALRHADINLRRERAVLEEQKLSIEHSLGQALRALDLNYLRLETAMRQLEAAERALKARQALFEIDKITLDELIATQQNLADATSNIYRTLVDYELARVQIQLERGTLANDLLVRETVSVGR